MGTVVNVTLVRVLLNWLLMTAPNSHIFELLVQPFKSGLVVVACSASSIFFFFWGGGGGGGGLAVKMTFGLVHADPLHPKASIYKDMGIV